MIFSDMFATTTLNAPDPWLTEALGGYQTASGITVNANTAIRLSSVFACVKVLVESLSQLPLHIYRKENGGRKVKAIDHPLYDILLNRPNNAMTPFDLKQEMMIDLCLGGTTYNHIIRDGAGQVVRLDPLDATKTKLMKSESGSYFYDVEGLGRLMFEDVWRVIGLSSDGLLGLPVINLQKEAIALGLAAERGAAANQNNGAKPSGIVTTEATKDLSLEALKILKKEFKKFYGGAANSGETIFLDAGMDFKEVSGDPVKSQQIETRKFQLLEICRIFRVPPHMVADLERATFSNIEHQSIAFVTHTLGPWIIRFEESIARDLLTKPERRQYFVKFQVNSLLRGDIKTRYEAYGLGIQNGFLNRNEVRSLEDMNSADGLDEFLTPLNMSDGPNLNKNEGTKDDN